VTSNAVDEALALPVAEVGMMLLQLAEDQWFDRKSVLVKPKDLAKPLTAFANAEGGTLVIGLSDGKIQGIAQHQKQLNALRQSPIDFTSPPVRAKFTEVSCVNDAGQADRLLIVRIDPGERVHETHDGECYLRIGDESRKLSYTQRQELEYDRGQSQYDGFSAAGVDESRLDEGLLGEYARIIGASNRKALEARSLLTLNGDVTNAAYLLFGRRPQDLFPQAYVRVLRY
jgi:ATP-dependent DNA helicase RecG